MLQTDDITLDANDTFVPKKRTPWDALGKVCTKTRQDDQENDEPPESVNTGNELICNSTEEKENDFKQAPNGLLIGCKQAPNGLLMGCKQAPETAPKWAPNRLQTGCKQAREIGCKQAAKQAPEVQSKLEQNKHSCHTQGEWLIQLVGVQRKVVLLLYSVIKNNANKTTGPLSLEYVAKTLNITKKTAKNTLFRLQKKGCIARAGGKIGKNGWSSFFINSELYQEILQREKQSFLDTELIHEIDSKWAPNGLLIGCKQAREIGCKQAPKQAPDAPVVSSYYINNNKYTNYGNSLLQSSESFGFNKINFDCLNEAGFGESHLQQIFSEYSRNPEISLSVELIQNSIDAFAFDLKHNNLAAELKRSPVVVLVSLLKSGRPYSSKTPERMLTPQEEAMRAHNEAQAKRRQTMLDLELKTKTSEQEEWLRSLPPEELSAFCELEAIPGISKKTQETLRAKNAREKAKEHFDNVIWPNRLQEILSKSTQ